MSGDGRTFYDIPAGARATECTGSTCRGVFYWVREGGRAIPADASVDGGVVPSDTADDTQADIFLGRADVFPGRGVHHMTVCPDREEIIARLQRERGA